MRNSEDRLWEAQTLAAVTYSCVSKSSFEGSKLPELSPLTLVGLGVCSECREALVADGYPEAPDEIRRIVERSWLGNRSIAGTPANIMAQFGYDLFFSKGFTSTRRERLLQFLEEDAAKELIKVLFGLVLAGLWLGLKT